MAAEPEIRRVNLAEVVLQDAGSFDFVSPPQPHAVMLRTSAVAAPSPGAGKKTHMSSSHSISEDKGGANGPAAAPA